MVQILHRLKVKTAKYSLLIWDLMLQYVYFIYQYMYIEFHLDVPHILYNNSFYKFNNFIIFLISDQPDICKFS